MESAGDSFRSRLQARWPLLLARLETLHARYSRVFWTLHSIWALLTGVAVLVLAHNRYGYLPWVIAFLALTWASTLFFSRLTTALSSRAWRLAQGFVSYITRIMYQETLFFLIPFYSYSTTFPSWNSCYVVVLASLAALSCYDLVFDRLLRKSRVFAMSFFSVVSFSALQYFFPLLFDIKVHLGAYLAAALAVLAAVPLAYPWREIREPRRLAVIALAVAAAVGLVRLARPAIPPVPLRLLKVRFTAAFDLHTHTPSEDFEDRVPASVLTTGRLFAVATIFAPNDLRTSVSIRFFADGKAVHTSRTVDVVAHPRGFRVYDALPLREGQPLPHSVVAEVWTAEGQLIGRAKATIVAGSHGH